MHRDSRREYLARIHCAQDYIEQHLDMPLTLDGIAAAAHFSPFHFHRLFTALTGETLYQFILRLRLERAAVRLCRHPHEPITHIALDHGFSSPATFARAFREHFGVSASEYRRAPPSKNCKMLGKECKAGITDSSYPDWVDSDSIRRTPMKTIPAQRIEVRDLPAKKLAYLRHVGPYAGEHELFERLWGTMCTWAGPRGLLHPPAAEFITIYHDNPNITADEKLRISLGITVPDGTPISGEIGLLDIPAGKYACALFELDPVDYAAAWNELMGVWLPQSGWQPGDGPTYECYLNDPKQHPQGKHLVEIRIHVKPL
ncbi:MAG: transcriptional regulator, AraC family [Burkholderiaceae bacterium]|nr:transcriptional regulator, AraC family [Burkholderiaceae bacterium]